MQKERERMVDDLRKKYGFDDSEILAVMLQVPRHKFVDRNNRDIAYSDSPVSIGFGQTMSQPYTVAFMTDLLLTGKLGVSGEKKLGKVLEIGTGSGYQAAVLSKLVKELYTVEIIPELAKRAGNVLRRLGYGNVFVKEGSGEWGWKEKSPFDAIIITAAIDRVPQELIDQLITGGILVAPIGPSESQTMTRFTKIKGLTQEDLKNPTLLKQRGAWEEFQDFMFVPFVSENK